MPRSAELVATIGSLLVEHNPFQPWRGPVPPALDDARGWVLPTVAGPMVLFALSIDGKDEATVAEAIAEWYAWLETLRAPEALLLLLMDEAHPAPRRIESPYDGTWQVWLVDLAASRLERLGDAAETTPFEQAVDASIAAYFAGTRFTPDDLEEIEEARAAGRMPFSRFLEAQKAPASNVLLVLIVAIFLATELLGGSTETSTLVRAGANYRPLVQEGEWWRLITANFLHIGWAHLLVNGYSLFAVGPTLEKLFGTSKFLAIYVFAGITGAVASFWFNAGGISAGASGALFGLLGAMLILGLRAKDAIPTHQKRAMRNIALVTLAINLAFGFTMPSIDNYAHLGGLVGGTILAALLGPHPTLLGRKRVRWKEALLALFPLLAAVGLAFGVWYVASGQTPLVWRAGPTEDYVIKVPLTMALPTEHRLFLSADRNDHWVSIESFPNPWPGPLEARMPLNESSLELYANPLAERFVGENERLATAPTVVKAGLHRFLHLEVTTHEGEREALYLTASPERLYLIRTRGLETVPWVRPTLELTLATFDFYQKHEDTP